MSVTPSERIILQTDERSKNRPLPVAMIPAESPYPSIDWQGRFAQNTRPILPPTHVTRVNSTMPSIGSLSVSRPQAQVARSNWLSLNGNFSSRPNLRVATISLHCSSMFGAASSKVRFRLFSIVAIRRRATLPVPQAASNTDMSGLSRAVIAPSNAHWASPPA